MTLNKNYVKRVEVRDEDDEVIATVRGLSPNMIIGLIDANRPMVQALFDKFNDMDMSEIREDEVLTSGIELIKQSPIFIAQIIAVATDAYDDWDAAAMDGQGPLEYIMDMPTGAQMLLLQKIAPLTFSSMSAAKKTLALAMNAVQGGGQSAP